MDNNFPQVLLGAHAKQGIASQPGRKSILEDVTKDTIRKTKR